MPAIDRDYMKAELAALSDAELYERTKLLLRLGHRTRNDPVDWAWRNEAWGEWCRRGHPGCFEEAVAAVQREIDAARQANRPA